MPLIPKPGAIKKYFINFLIGVIVVVEQNYLPQAYVPLP